MYKILIIEDDLTIANVLCQHLVTWGFDTHYVTDFRNTLGEFIDFKPQLILLDVTLPSYNGYHWCTEIRKISKIPIIFISSANDNMNIVMAMSQGGDDFVTKPFDLNVITAKIQALLRRTYDFSEQSELIRHKDAILNLVRATLIVEGEEIELTKNEFRILTVLFENKERPVSRDVLMARLWENDCFVDDNTLTVNITRLRKKLSDVGLCDNFIVTIKGTGYKLQ